MVVVSDLSFLQCFDTAGWLTGTASASKSTRATYPKGSLLEQVEYENWLTQVHLKNGC